MKVWAKQLREFLSKGYNWELFENDPNHFWESLGEKDYTTVTLFCHGRINGTDWATYMSNVTDLINTYILPHYTGPGDDGWHYVDKDQFYHPYWMFTQYFPGLDNPFVNAVDFILKTDVDKIYTQAEIDSLKQTYPAALVDALELKTEADKKPEKTEDEKKSGENDDYTFLVVIGLIIAALWILDD